jgi:hypothetical protein
MKPRLGSAPLTREDSWIWGFASYPRDLGDARFARALYGESMEQDRRDADRILNAMRHRVGSWGPLLHWSPEQPDYTYEYIWFGGALLSAKAVNPRAASNITYFA